MVGETTVTATATDAAGNNASCTFKVTVTFVDTQAPVITCPPTATATTAGAATTVTYPPATATESAVLTYSQASGSVFSVGDTSVVATATDAAGNASSCTFVVKVAKTAAKGGGCGCASTGEQSGLMFTLLGAAAVLARRRRRS